MDKRAPKKKRKHFSMLRNYQTADLITLANGAAGTAAILAPGQVRRSTALRNSGGDALGIELGCMVMLVIAGLIEGFVSPSSIDYASRVGVLGATLMLWTVYFIFAGRSSAQKEQSQTIETGYGGQIRNIHG